jgi:hypothetical protein
MLAVPVPAAACAQAAAGAATKISAAAAASTALPASLAGVREAAGNSPSRRACRGFIIGFLSPLVLPEPGSRPFMPASGQQSAAGAVTR